MSKKDYSLDDILNEYSGNSPKKAPEPAKPVTKTPMSLTEILNTTGAAKKAPAPEVPAKREQEAHASAEKKALKQEKTSRLSFQDSVKLSPIRPKAAGNSDLTEKMLHLKRERSERTNLVPPVSRKKIEDIDLKLDDKILPDTAQIPVDSEASELEKLKELHERRKKKIKDFVLVGDEEDSEEFPNGESEDEDEEDAGITDFESFDDAPSIAEDIVQLKASLTIRLVILLITSVCSVYIALANDLGLPMFELINKNSQPTAYLFICITLGLLSAFASYTMISCGISKLFSLQADCDTVSALAVISSLLTAAASLAYPPFIKEGITHIYISAAIVSLLVNTIGKLLIVNRTARNFKYVSGDFERYALFTVQNEERANLFTRGTLNDFPVLASMRKTEFISDFLKSSYAPDATDSYCRIAVPAMLGGSLLCGILAGVLSASQYGANAIFSGLSVFSGTIALCASLAVILVVSFPMDKASKKYIESSGVMLSYDSVEEFADTNSVLLDVEQLFPHGMVNLTAIKIFSDTKIDDAIVEAASLTNHAGSILKTMFYDIIVGKTEMLNPVESYIYEDSMGLCGWINNRRVLLGNRELMLNHSISGLPTPERELEYTVNGRQAIYLSIAGELSAMFVVEIRASLEIRHWLRELQKNGVYLILRSVDSIISINKLSEMFGISPEYLKIMPFRLQKEFEEETTYTTRQTASLACSGRFPAFASLIVGAKRLRKSVSMGLLLQSAGAVLGLALSVILTAMSCFGQCTPTLVLLYNLFWSGLTFLLQAIRRS